MKKNQIKKPIFSIITFFCLSSSALGGKYADIFTRDIYEQSTVLAKTFKSEEEKDQALVKHLNEAKKEALAKKCLQKITDKINNLQQIYTSAEEREFLREALGGIGKGLQNLGAGLGSLIAPIGQTVGGTLGGLLAIPLQVLEQNIIKTKKLSGEQAQLIATEIRKLHWEIEDLIDGLENEPIKDLEIKYIKQKRKINNVSLNKEIEIGLLDARKLDFIATNATQFVDLALKLPIQTKPLFDSSYPLKSRCDILEKFNHYSFFQNYAEKTRKILRNIVTQTAADSIASKDSMVPSRKTYYLWGDPSAGKTSAALEIVQFLGVPYIDMTSRSAAEFAQGNVEGQDRNMGQNPNPGWIARALMVNTPQDDQSYNNSFIIINDLDRIINGVKPDAAIPFLLDFLDPSKKEFRNPYFRSGIDISHLNIIITANQEVGRNSSATNQKNEAEIPSNILKNQEIRENSSSISAKKEADAPPNALKTRFFKEIRFPKFTEAQASKIMKSFTADVIKRHHVPKEFEFEYKDPTFLRMNFDAKAYQFHGISQNLLETFLEGLTTLLEKECTESNGQFSLPTFILSTGVSPEEENITLREIQHRIDDTMNQFMNDFLEKGMSWFSEAKKIVPSNKEKALELFTCAALTGHPGACYELGKLYDTLTPPYPVTSMPHASSTVSASSSATITTLPNNKQQALFWYKKGAERGHAESAYKLGFLYEKGLKVFQDLIIAFKFYEIAAFQNNSEAQYKVGVMYSEGRGVIRNDAKAFEWLQKAAKQDYKNAQFYVGYLYEKGQGVEQDDTKSFNWYQRAALQDHGVAQFRVGRMYHLGKGIQQDYKLAMEWYQKAAHQGHPMAPLYVGDMYYQGEGVEQDDKRGLEWYLKGQQCVEAQFPIGNLHESIGKTAENYTKTQVVFDADDTEFEYNRHTAKVKNNQADDNFTSDSNRPPAKIENPPQDAGNDEIISIPHLNVAIIQDINRGYSLRLMPPNPTSDSLHLIKPGELGLFCEGDKLYCKLHNKEKKQIIRSDKSSIRGLSSDSFDRIQRTMNDSINIEYYNVALQQEEERKQSLANHNDGLAFSGDQPPNIDFCSSSNRGHGTTPFKVSKNAVAAQDLPIRTSSVPVSQRTTLDATTKESSTTTTTAPGANILSYNTEKAYQKGLELEHRQGNIDTAMFYYEKAASQGHAEAQKCLNNLIRLREQNNEFKNRIKKTSE